MGGSEEGDDSMAAWQDVERAFSEHEGSGGLSRVPWITVEGSCGDFHAKASDTEQSGDPTYRGEGSSIAEALRDLASNVREAGRPPPPR